MEEKMKEAEITIGSSIIRRLYHLLEKNSYNLTQDQEEDIFKFACKHREFSDGMLVDFIETSRACLNGHEVEMKKTVTLRTPPVTVPVGSSSGTDLREEYVTLQIHDWNWNRESYRINCGTPMNILVKAYCERHSMEPDSIRFIFYGRLVRGEDTPFDLKLKDGYGLHAAPLRFFKTAAEV